MYAHRTAAALLALVIGFAAMRFAVAQKLPDSSLTPSVRVTASPARRAPTLSKREQAVAFYHAASAAQSAGKPSEAERLYLIGEAEDPSFAGNFQGLILLYLGQRNYAAADVQLHSLLAFHPDLVGVNYQLGEVQRSEHLYALAIASYDAELRLNPKSQPALAGRALAEDALNGQAGTGSDIITSARDYVTDVSQDFGFAGVPLPAPLPAEDVETLSALVQSSTSEADLLSAGSTALQIGSLDVAESAFERAAAADPTDWRALYFAGLAARAADDPAAAGRHFAAALKLSARPEPQIELALVELDEGKMQAAYSAAQSALALDPKNSTAAFLTGMLGIVVSDAKAAIKDLTQALSSPNRPERTGYFLEAAKKQMHQ